jgi:hypothetical protein
MGKLDQLQQTDIQSDRDMKESPAEDENISTLERHKWERHKWYRVKSNDPKGIRSKTDILIIQATGVRSINGQELLEKLDPREVEQLEGAEKLFISELELTTEKKYTLANLTSERITVRNYYTSDKNLFVPGFGTRNLNGKDLLDLDYLGWESQGLIKISEETDEEKVQSTIAGSLIGLTMILLFFFLIVSVPLALQGSAFITWPLIGIVTLIALVLVSIMFVFAGRHNKKFAEGMKNWITLLPGILLTLATGVGLPVLIIYVYGDAMHGLTNGLVGTPPGLGSLGRFLQTAFITIASILPAFLFYLFGRQQADKQRENFYREAMLLDPNVWSYSESKNKYGPLLDTVNDTGNSPLSIILLVTSTALLVLGWLITIAPLGQALDNLQLFAFFQPTDNPFVFGFLGAYFFTINLVYRRYVRADLTPKTYAYITMRLITTFVLVWAVSLLPFSTGLSAIAFTIGIFPESALTLIQDYVNKLTAQRRGQYQEQYSLKKLEGMNLYDQARLMEEGIENIENLAHHNLMELIVRTRIPTARLVDMFDQAILYLHLGLEDEDDGPGTKEEEVGNPADPDNRKLLKSLGIRTATDLLGCKEEITAFQGNVGHAALVNKLDIIISAMEDDEWLNYILSWRENSSTKYSETIDNPYKFYAIVSERVASLPRKRKRYLDKLEAPAEPKAPEKQRPAAPETASAGA